jgi:predicted dehydrogenase
LIIFNIINYDDMKRKRFIRLSAMGSVAMAASMYIPSWQSRKLRIGLIGAGWYGMVITNAALKSGGVEVIGICDVDSEHLNTSADQVEKLQGSRPATMKNYNDLLNIKGLEAVLIGTIPHWHALQFIAACEKGLDIYCEKPLSYDVVEGAAMVAAAQKAGNIVQIGFQRRQAGSYMKVKELIGEKRIGNIHQINARIHYNPGIQDTRIQEPPASLDWEEWCGPAPKLEYRPSIGHRTWRLEKEYGNGHLVDWGIHHIDIIRKITDENLPLEFHTTGGIKVLKDQITTPDTLNSVMKFRNFPVIWEHRLWGNGDVNSEFNNGIFFYGESGTIFANDSRVVLYPSGKGAKSEEFNIPAPLMQENHVVNFLDAVRSKDRSLISCTPEDAFRSTATVQLAMISYYSDSIVKWDEEGKKIIDNPDASALLKREYRDKYKHP